MQSYKRSNNDGLLMNELFGLKGRKTVFALLLIMLLFLAAGCGKKSDQKKDEPLQKEPPKTDPKDLPKPAVPEDAQPGSVQWTYGSNAISLQLKADSMLNSYEDKAHTLVLCVYQLSDPNAYTDMAKTQEGIIKLLQCTRFGDTVTGVNRIILQPNETRTVFLDRAVGTQYVAIAAGYYNVNPDKASTLFKIPIDVHKKGLIFKDTYLIPGRLDLGLFLGPGEIQQTSVD